MNRTPRAFFQTTFNPIGRACAARHARAGLGLQGKWRTRACVPHTPYHAGYGLLNPNSHPVLSPRGRELERGQQAARLVLGRLELGCWERLPKFGECPLPSPPPRGRGQVAADSGVAGRLKKNARNINGRNFSGSLLSQSRWNKHRERFFRRPLSPSGRGCTARHACGGLGFQGKWTTRACVPHTSYMRAF